MKSAFKVFMIVLVATVWVIGGNAIYAKDDTVKKAEVKEKACCSKHEKVDKKAAVAHKCVHKTVYVCPVEKCTYKSDKPGECPHCKKELVKKEVCGMKIYVCPVETCDFKAHKPGKCPKCNKELVEKIKWVDAHQVYYVCPMKKCNYKAHKPGKCPKCGMELKKVEKTCCDTEAVQVPKAPKAKKAPVDCTKTCDKPCAKKKKK